MGRMVGLRRTSARVARGNAAPWAESAVTEVMEYSRGDRWPPENTTFRSNKISTLTMPWEHIISRQLHLQNPNPALGIPPRNSKQSESVRLTCNDFCQVIRADCLHCLMRREEKPSTEERDLGGLCLSPSTTDQSKTFSTSAK